MHQSPHHVLMSPAQSLQRVAVRLQQRKSLAVQKFVAKRNSGNSSTSTCGPNDTPPTSSQPLNSPVDLTSEAEAPSESTQASWPAAPSSVEDPSVPTSPSQSAQTQQPRRADSGKEDKLVDRRQQRVGSPSGLQQQRRGDPSGLQQERVDSPSGLQQERVGSPTGLQQQRVGSPSGLQQEIMFAASLAAADPLLDADSNSSFAEDEPAGALKAQDLEQGSTEAGKSTQADSNSGASNGFLNQPAGAGSRQSEAARQGRDSKGLFRLDPGQPDSSTGASNDSFKQPTGTEFRQREEASQPLSGTGDSNEPIKQATEAGSRQTLDPLAGAGIRQMWPVDSQPPGEDRESFQRASVSNQPVDDGQGSNQTASASKQAVDNSHESVQSALVSKQAVDEGRGGLQRPSVSDQPADYGRGNLPRAQESSSADGQLQSDPGQVPQNQQVPRLVHQLTQHERGVFTLFTVCMPRWRFCVVMAWLTKDGRTRVAHTCLVTAGIALQRKQITDCDM